MELRHEEIATVFSRELFEKFSAGRATSRRTPIFIVGLPRSGSTLVEQILASHSQVEGTAELPTLMHLAAIDRPLPRGQEEYPEGRSRPAWPRTSRPTASSTSRKPQLSAPPNRPYFTDKMPNNFSHVGLIHLILPNAKIINARRHPSTAAWAPISSCGARASTSPTTWPTSRRTTGSTTRRCSTGTEVLPGKVLDVHYEETVTDLETQVRRILAHCGLPFEEACVRFHETHAPVKTASSEQVRQPIYTGALGYWRRYEKYLDLWLQEFGDIIAELPEVVRNAGT